MSAREVIARAIEPDAFDHPPEFEPWAAQRRASAYAKAYKYLAALDAAGKVVVDRKTLIEARDEITSYVKREYAGCEGYPSMERRMQRDLELARELGRLAAAKEGER
jgi:hypothetical protein